MLCDAIASLAASAIISCLLSALPCNNLLPLFDVLLTSVVCLIFFSIVSHRDCLHMLISQIYNEYMALNIQRSLVTQNHGNPSLPMILVAEVH